MGSMTEVFGGDVPVHYGFIFLSSDGDVGAELIEARLGQSNGLCGAMVAGQLSVVTGLHTGSVRLVVEWSADEPPHDGGWEDVVEVSFEVTQHDMVLSGFEDFFPLRMPATGMHRARFCAAGMDAGREIDTVVDGLGPDHYLLQLWPAGSAPDVIVREGSDIGRYWHAVAARGD